jgi:hypothetical protein
VRRQLVTRFPLSRPATRLSGSLFSLDLRAFDLLLIGGSSRIGVSDQDYSTRATKSDYDENVLSMAYNHNGAGAAERQPQWRFLARRQGGNWLHVYTSHKPTELEAVIEFGESQPQCFWQMEWQVVNAAHIGAAGA